MAGDKNGSFRRTMLELVIVTGIFAIVSVFLLQFYLKANHLQADAVAISSSLMRAESLADAVKTYGAEEAADRFDLQSQEKSYYGEYDSDWKFTNQDPIFRLELVVESEADGLQKTVVSAKNMITGEVYCTLQVYSYH